MDIEQLKIEPAVVVKEELEFDKKYKFAVELENEEKPEIVEECALETEKPYAPENVEKKSSEFDKHVCGYCGESKLCCDMSLSPQHPRVLETWGQILGNEFYQKALSNSSTYICRNHFNEKWKNQRSRFIFPCVQHVNVLPNNVNYSKCPKTMQNSILFTCCYCGTTKCRTFMKTVTKDDPNFAEWVKSFGKTFSDHFLNNRNGFICQSHFVVKLRKITTNEESNGMITCIYCEKSKFEYELTMVPLNMATLREWAQILGKNFQRKALANTKTFICRSHFDVEWETWRPLSILPRAEPDKMESDKASNLPTCCYCGTSRVRKFMKVVTKDDPNFIEWVKAFGKTFSDHFSNNNSGFVCQNHFVVKLKEAAPKIWEIEKLKKQKKRREVIQKNLLPVKCLPKTNDKCVYCGESRYYRELTKVPQSSKVLKKWSQILGEDFYGRAIGNPKTFICRSHFDVEWEDRRPRSILPFANSFKMVSNEIKGDPTLMDVTQVKLDETKIGENSDQKYFDRLDYEHLDIESEMKPEKASLNMLPLISSLVVVPQDSYIFNETSNWIKREDFLIQDESFDPKRIKIEVKEEEND